MASSEAVGASQLEERQGSVPPGLGERLGQRLGERVVESFFGFGQEVGAPDELLSAPELVEPFR